MHPGNERRKKKQLELKGRVDVANEANVIKENYNSSFISICRYRL